MTPNAGSCYVSSACYANGAVNPTNACETCQSAQSGSAWTARTNSCAIGATCYAQGAVNPVNSCQTCVPGTSATAWTALGKTAVPSGRPCYAQGAANPGNSLRVVMKTATGRRLTWTRNADGSACQSDGVSCTNDVCQLGACTHPVAATSCLIAGGCYGQGQLNPANGCQSCQSATSTTTWTVMKATERRVMAYRQPDLSCTTDQCTTGLCKHALTAGSCDIGGACYAQGAVNGANPCQTCQPGDEHDGMDDPSEQLRDRWKLLRERDGESRQCIVRAASRA